MIMKPLPFRDLNIRIPIIIPIEGREFIDQGPTLGLGFRVGYTWRRGETLNPRS